MIALIASARPERGDGTPTYYTVPWCPSIATNPVAQMPGTAMVVMRSILARCSALGLHPSKLRELRFEHFLYGGVVTGKVLEAMLINFSVKLMVELEMVPEVLA